MERAITSKIIYSYLFLANIITNRSDFREISEQSCKLGKYIINRILASQRSIDYITAKVQALLSRKPTVKNVLTKIIPKRK